MKNNHFIEINAEFSVKNFPFLSHSPPFLYINRNLALPLTNPPAQEYNKTQYIKKGLIICAE